MYHNITLYMLITILALLNKIHDSDTFWILIQTKDYYCLSISSIVPLKDLDRLQRNIFEQNQFV